MTTALPRRRAAAAITVPALLAGALVGVFAPLAAPPMAHAAIGECPTGTYPGVGAQPAPGFTDNNIAVYVGGDFFAGATSAEVEGRFVVEGDALIDKTAGGRFNVGTVGVGSGIVPSPGSVMFAVGGDLSVIAPTVLDVGANAFDADSNLLGGALEVGGEISPTPPTPHIETNNGTLSAHMGSAATAPYAGFDATLISASADFRSRTAVPGVVSGARVTFDGAIAQASTDLYVFEVSAVDLSAVTEVFFEDVPDDVPVVINVTGAGPVTFAPTYFANDEVRVDDFGSAGFGLVSARTMWNIVDAADVTIGGSNQVLGSFMIPAATGTLTITASTNGRIYTNGDLDMLGTGNELHNFPWFGPGDFDCKDARDVTGQITLQKLLAPGTEEYLPNGPEGLPEFHGTLTCALDDGGVDLQAWTLRPPNVTTFTGLPIGAECTITEDLSHVTSGADTVLADLVWNEPVWTVDGVAHSAPVSFTVPDPASATEINVIVTNELAMGAFTIEKVVQNSAGVDFTDGFTGTWVCTHSDVPAAASGMSGAWSLVAGETTEPHIVPLGSTCDVTEDTPAPPASGSWSAPVIAPQHFEVTDAETTVAVVITNTITDEEVRAGSFRVTKVVENSTNVVVTTTFTGTVTCTIADDELVFVWSLTAGQTSDVFQAPLGSACEVTEEAPANPSGATWQTPVISPASFTVNDADTVIDVVVTNLLVEELPATGADVPWAGVGLGVGAVMFGGVLLLIRRRRDAAL